MNITPIIITLLIVAAVVAFLLWLDRRRLKSYRAKRDEQSNAAWRPVQEEKDGE